MNLRPVFLLTIYISILAACTKIKSTDIGTDLIPPVDNITTFDKQLSVTTRNFYDTAPVFPLRGDNMVLGRISNDPLFGKTTGIINVQLTPEYFQYRFRGTHTSRRLDSMVLVLSYRGVWGDTINTSNASQTLRVYEVDPTQSLPLVGDSLYATKAHFKPKPAQLGVATIDPRNVWTGPDTLKLHNEFAGNTQIRIQITDQAIKDLLFTDTTLLDSAKGFMNKFAGFTIIPDTTGSSNNLFVINLSDTNTKVAFYYRDSIDGKPDTAVAYFRMGASAGFSNQIIRNPSAPAAEFISTLDVADDNLVYLQTRPDAPYTRIKIPGLDSLQNAIIHRAELIIEQVRTAPGPNSMDDYFTPPALFLSAFSNDSSRRFMLPSSDVQFTVNGVSNLADFGAFPNRRFITGEGDVTFYAFNLTRYVQGIATNKNRNYEMVLWAPFADYVYAVENFNTIIPITGTSIMNPLALGRIRVGGGTHSTHRMRLRIIYTRI